MTLYIENFQKFKKETYKEVFDFVKEQVSKGYWIAFGSDIIKTKNGLSKLGSILEKHKESGFTNGIILEANPDTIVFDDEPSIFLIDDGKLIRTQKIARVVTNEISNFEIIIN